MNLRFVLLALLSDEPNTGYGLGRALNGEVKHLWDTSLQQIYGELRAMQAASLIDQQIVAIPNRPAKKIYSITPQGRAELQQWLAGPAAAQRHRDSFLVKLYLPGPNAFGCACPVLGGASGRIRGGGAGAAQEDGVCIGQQPEAAWLAADDGHRPLSRGSASAVV